MTLAPEQIMAHWKPILGAVRRILPHQDPAVWEDLAADTVERAIRCAHQFGDQSGSGPGGWLCVMAQRIAIDYLRRHANHTLTLTEWTPLGATVDAGSSRHVDHLAVHHALTLLQEPARAILTNYYLRGIPLKDQGMPNGNLKLSRRHTKALRQMAAVMEAV